MQPPAPDAVNLPQYITTLWGRECPYDEIIDVRAPIEYAEDHIPGAINLPVLSNSERAEVGTLHRDLGPFRARKVGAAYVSANIARFLQQHFAHMAKGYRPFIYCWRGGQRSASLAIVLAQIGWRVTVLQGGYKTYRDHVRRELLRLPGEFRYRIISGATGSGKTRLLQDLAALGAQVLDLEELAGHRGSILGSIGPQPSQKAFDSRLLAALQRLEPARTVWLEAESNRVGNVFLPDTLWAKMQTADGIELRVPVGERVRYLIAAYEDLRTQPEVLKQKLEQLSGRQGMQRIESWCKLVDCCEWDTLVESLLENHYDPAYRVSAQRWFPNVTRNLDLASLADDSLAIVARELDQLDQEMTNMAVT